MKTKITPSKDKLFYTFYNNEKLCTESNFKVSDGIWNGWIRGWNCYNSDIMTYDRFYQNNEPEGEDLT